MRLTEKKGLELSLSAQTQNIIHDLLVSHLKRQADHLIKAGLPLFWC